MVRLPDVWSTENMVGAELVRVRRPGTACPVGVNTSGRVVPSLNTTEAEVRPAWVPHTPTKESMGVRWGPPMFVMYTDSAEIVTGKVVLTFPSEAVT